MVNYGELCKIIKNQDKELEFVNILGIHEFVISERVNRKGKYVVTLSFDSKEMLVNPNCLPRRNSDFIYRPMLLILKYKEKAEAETLATPTSAEGVK